VPERIRIAELTLPQLMATAGYDPRGATDLWELMSCVELDAAQSGHPVSAENRFGFLRTHPTSEARMAALDKDMEKAMKVWKDHSPRRPTPKPSPKVPEEKNESRSQTHINVSGTGAQTPQVQAAS
jgi:predicted Zn-dependent protease